jgi:hypothetical protein
MVFSVLFVESPLVVVRRLEVIPEYEPVLDFVVPVFVDYPNFLP